MVETEAVGDIPWQDHSAMEVLSCQAAYSQRRTSLFVQRSSMQKEFAEQLLCGGERPGAGAAQ